jgi:hypothetical protein
MEGRALTVKPRLYDGQRTVFIPMKMRPMVQVLIQLDQHDFAVRNRLTLREHRDDLDVPSWEECPRSGHGPGSVAAEIARVVR